MKQRIFIAFKVVEDIKTQLITIQEELKEKNKKAHVSWSKPAGFHVTVGFLGGIEAHQIEEVKNILLEISTKYHSFKYWLDHLDAFPNTSQPKIINMKCSEEHRASFTIHDKIEHSLKKIKIIKEIHPWQPHITLGRNRGDARIQGLDTINFEKKTWEVDTIEMIKSDPQSGGSKYTVLESYQLANNI